jgi:hypothetical protein
VVNSGPASELKTGRLKRKAKVTNQKRDAKKGITSIKENAAKAAVRDHTA